MAVKKNMATMTVYTDSATVYGWVQSVIRDQRLYNRLGEMLILRRLSIITEFIEA